MPDNEHLLSRINPKPEPEDEQEKALKQDVGKCGMVWQKGCRALDVERGAEESIFSFQYVYLSVHGEFAPGKFWVIFAGLTHWKLTVEGRNLRPLYDRLNDHCLRRIRTLPRDMEEDGKPFVTKMEVQDVTPTDEES